MAYPYVCDGDLIPFDNDTHYQNTVDPRAADVCPGRNQFIDFWDHKWWINYHWSLKDGTYFWGNGDFRTEFDPHIIKSIDPRTVQLAIRAPRGPDLAWRTSEIVLANKYGYGTYLVTAKADRGDFSKLNPDAVFGMFTYQYSCAPPGEGMNQHREIDAIEIIQEGGSRGKAQFTLQPWEVGNPRKQFDIPPGTNILTMVIDWREVSGVPTCKWRLFYKDADLTTISSLTPDQSWDGAQFQKHIPRFTKNSCARFHINLWLMHGQNALNEEETVTLTRFQFMPPRGDEVA